MTQEEIDRLRGMLDTEAQCLSVSVRGVSPKEVRQAEVRRALEHVALVGKWLLDALASPPTLESYHCRRDLCLPNTIAGCRCPCTPCDVLRPIEKRYR